MCDTGVCLFRIRSCKHKKSPVVCLCYLNFGKLSINKKAKGLSASVEKILMFDDLKLSPGPPKRCCKVSTRTSFLSWPEILDISGRC